MSNMISMSSYRLISQTPKLITMQRPLPNYPPDSNTNFPSRQCSFFQIRSFRSLDSSWQTEWNCRYLGFEYPGTCKSVGWTCQKRDKCWVSGLAFLPHFLPPLDVYELTALLLQLVEIWTLCVDIFQRLECHCLGSGWTVDEGYRMFTKDEND